MKRIKAILTASALTITALVSAAWYAPHPDVCAAEQVNIMPIGDSITFGLGEDGGYRKYLDYALKSKDIAFDMVGPEGKNSDSFTYNGQHCEYDGNHAGYSGFTIKQQYPIPSWGENGLLERLKSKDAIKKAQPDIVLLIIGTNDMTANRNLNDCEKDLHSLIDYIRADMPEDGVIFMGSIPEFTEYGGNPQRVGNYNATVQKVAESYDEHVRFADVHGSLDGMADISGDKLHPSGAGYEKMGKFWAEVIESYLEEQNGGLDTPDNPEILHSDFESSLSGWKERGGATVVQTTAEAAEGTGSASISGRTADWNGIAYALSSKRCPAGTHLRIQARVLQKTDSPVHFKMTMQYSGSESAVYDTFAEIDAAPGEWTTITARDYVMQEGSSPVLYIETDKDLCDFYLDEVTVTKTDGTVEPDPAPAGDVNGDGACTAADAVALQKWILGDASAKLGNAEAADLCADGVIDVYDLGMLKRILLGQ